MKDDRLMKDNSRRQKEYRLRVLQSGPIRVPAGRAQAHLRELSEYASNCAIAAAAGVHQTTISRVLNGSIRNLDGAKEKQILAVGHNQIRDLGSGHKVNSVGAARRVQALAVLGWSSAAIAEATGHPWQLIVRLQREGQPEVSLAVDRRIRRAFRELCMSHPLADNRYTRSGVSRVKRRAAEAGWLPPLAWDDIDDPNESPNLDVAVSDDVDQVAVERLCAGDRVSASRTERQEAMRVLIGRGMSDVEVAARLDTTARTVLRWRDELGITSRWEQAS